MPLTRRALMQHSMALTAGSAGRVTAATPAEPSRPELGPGRLDAMEWPARGALGGRTVRVWTPNQYGDDTRRYQVLYMHDGQNVFDGKAAAFGGESWAVHRQVQRLMEAGRIGPTLVVGIHNTALRWREYVPAPAVQDLPADWAAVVAADPAPEARQSLSNAYVDWIVETLKPRIDTLYRTRPERESTFIMGSSMGGQISLYALTRRPDAFAGAGCVSTHWPVSVNYPLLVPPLDARLAGVANRYLDWLARAVPAAGRHRLYFDHGTANLDGLYEPFQRRMDVIAATLGYVKERDLLSLRFEGADHNEQSWRARVHRPLTFLLQPRA